MNFVCCIIFFVFYFVGFGKIEATITSQQAKEIVQAWRHKNSIQPDVLAEYAVFMGASELTELRKHEGFKKPYTVLDEDWKAEVAEKVKKNPEYKPTVQKGVEDIDEGDFTYEDGDDKYHVIWGKSFVEAGDLKTDVEDKVKVGEVRKVKEGDKEVEKGGAEVTLSVENLLTPKMLVTKGINAITNSWEKKGIPSIEHNKFVEMRVGVFMLKCINTQKWNPTRSVVVLKLRYKSELSDIDYFLKQIKAYRERTYVPPKPDRKATDKFVDNLKYNQDVSRQAAEDAEKWKVFANEIPKVDQQDTKNNQKNVPQNTKSSKLTQQTPSTPSNKPTTLPQQTDSNAAMNIKATIDWFEGYAAATAEAAKQKKLDEANAKEKDAQSVANFKKILTEWNERIKKADLAIYKSVYEVRMQVLEEAKKRANTIGYQVRKNMYRIELSIPKPSSPLGLIFTEQEYVIHKILEKKNEFPYFLYKHATDLGYGYKETKDGKSFAAVVLIQVGDSTQTEDKLNKAIYDVIVANIRNSMDASAQLFSYETDALPPALYELIYGVSIEALAQVEAEVLKQLEKEDLTAEQKDAKVKAAQQNYVNSTAHPPKSHDAPASSEKKGAPAGSPKTSPAK